MKEELQQLTEERAIEVMEERGYVKTAMIERKGKEPMIVFQKTRNDIVIEAMVDMNGESIILKIGLSQYSCEMISQVYKFFHPKFEEFEKILYLYGKTCSEVDVLIDDMELIKDVAKGVMVEMIKQDEPVLAKKINEKLPIKQRKQEFGNQVVSIGKAKGYEKEMCTEFYNYWTEINEGGKKMRFEKEDTFELPKRLLRWLNNDKKWLAPWKAKQEEKNKEQQIELTTTKKTPSKKELYS